MATRLYLQNAAPGYTPATKRGTWSDSSSTVARGLGAQSGANTSYGLAETANTTWDALLARFISAPLANAKSFTASDTVQWMIGLAETNAAMNAMPHVHIFVTVGSTDALRGTLLANSIGVTEFSGNCQGEGALALSAVSAQVGDRIVVELGYQAQNTKTTSYTGTAYYGGTGTDATNGSAPTTTVGWIEFSVDGLFSTTTPVAIAGALASSGALGKSPSKILAGTLAASASVARSIAKVLTGALASGGELVKELSAHLAGSLAASAELSKGISLAFDGALVEIGGLTTFSDGYEVERKVGVGSWAAFTTTLPGTTNYHDPGPFSQGETYYYRVRRVSSGLSGQWSNVGYVVFAGPGTYYVNVSGDATFSALVQRAVMIGLLGNLLSSGSLGKQVAISALGLLSAVGLVTKVPAKAAAGELASSGAVIREPSKLFAGTLAGAGVLVKTTSKIFAGALAGAATLVKGTGIHLAGTLAQGGAIHVLKALSVFFTGTLATGGTLARSVTKALAGALASGGSVGKSASKGLGGALGSTGSLTKALSKALAGALVTSGAVETLQSLSLFFNALLASSGSVSKGVAKQLSGTLAPSGALVKAATRFLVGALATGGSLARSVSKKLAGALASSGAISVLRSLVVFLAGTLASSGALGKQADKLLAGALASSGTLVKTASHSMAGVLVASGSLGKTVSKALAGLLGSAGSVLTSFLSRLLPATGQVTLSNSSVASAALSTVLANDVALSLATPRVLLSNASGVATLQDSGPRITVSDTQG